MTVCVACGSDRSAAGPSLPKLDYRRCLRCGTWFADPMPDAEGLKAIYNDGYAQERGHDRASIDLAKARTCRRFLSPLGPARGRRLLEIGCSTGTGLRTARDLGFRVSGVEVNALAARAAGEEFDVFCGGLIEYEPSAPFDVVAMFDVIEHFPDPTAALSKAGGCLTPGGTLLLVTPEVGSWSQRILRGRWPHLIPEHVVLFSREGLTRALQRAGMAVTVVGSAVKNVSTHMLHRHMLLFPHLRLGSVGRFLARLPEVAFPIPVGEMTVIARAPGAPE